MICITISILIIINKIILQFRVYALYQSINLELVNKSDFMAGFGTLDFVVIILFFILIVYFGYLFKQVARSTSMFFLAGRSLPAWLAGITFITGNVSEMEILGLTGGAYVYGMVFAQYDWIGAIPAIVFLALVLIPFYYSNQIYNLPEYFKIRYGEGTRQAITFLMLSLMLLSLGTGLYVFALALFVILGLPIWAGIIVSAIVLGLITASGGLRATVLVQFLAFSFTWFTLLPIPFLALSELGGWQGLQSRVSESMLTVWPSADASFMPWPAIVFGLAIALAGASWATDQAIMQNALAAKSLEDARRAPLVGGVIKLAVPLITVIPGLAAAVLIPGLQRPDTAIFELILRYYPLGLAGVAFLSVMGAFTAMNTGMITGISNIFTRNIYKQLIQTDASEEHYLRISRLATIGALILGVLTAFIAAQYLTVYLWIQEFNIFIIVPVFAVLLWGIFSHRATPMGAYLGLSAGVISAIVLFILTAGNYFLQRASIVFAIVLIVTGLVSYLSKQKVKEKHMGAVWGTLPEEASPAKTPIMTLLFASVLLVILTVLLIIFA